MSLLRRRTSRYDCRSRIYRYGQWLIRLSLGSGLIIRLSTFPVVVRFLIFLAFGAGAAWGSFAFRVVSFWIARLCCRKFTRHDRIQPFALPGVHHWFQRCCEPFGRQCSAPAKMSIVVRHARVVPLDPIPTAAILYYNLLIRRFAGRWDVASQAISPKLHRFRRKHLIGFDVGGESLS